MANTRLIKRRIKSAQNISQITRAMEMVAASKMKKAQDTAVSGKPYAEKIYQVTKELAKRTEKCLHSLLASGSSHGKLLVIVISTNKGLCGGLNTNLFRMLYTRFNQEGNIDYITLGKKGQSFVIRSGKNLVADFSQKLPFTENVPALTKFIVDGYTGGIYKEVYLIYNSFVTALKQMPTRKMILPITTFEPVEQAEDISTGEFLIEPNIHDVLDSLLPHYLENQIRSAILEAEASEHSARMVAMKNATQAAFDLMSELTLIYNKARQEKITNEIADIVTARLAVE